MVSTATGVPDGPTPGAGRARAWPSGDRHDRRARTRLSVCTAAPAYMTRSPSQPPSGRAAAVVASLIRPSTKDRREAGGDSQPLTVAPTRTRSPLRSPSESARAVGVVLRPRRIRV